MNTVSKLYKFSDSHRLPQDPSRSYFVVGN